MYVQRAAWTRRWDSDVMVARDPSRFGQCELGYARFGIYT